MRTYSAFLSLALCLPTLGACSRSEPAHQPVPSAAPVEALAKPNPPASPTPVVEDPTFRLSLATAAGYDGAKDGQVELTLEARGGYHVNQDYPIRVDLKAPGDVKLAKATLGKPDATTFSEQQARFALPFSASAGQHDVSATVDFAVCTKETCMPDQRTVVLALRVQ